MNPEAMKDGGGTPREGRTSRALDRRAFLGSVGAALAGAACGWDGGETLRPAIVSVSRLGDRLGQRLLTPDGPAPKYPREMSSSAFPSYHISRMTPTLAEPDRWRLRVGGLVRRPLELSIDDIRALDRVTYTVKHHCVEGWSAIGTWTGARFWAFAEEAGVLPEARYLRFDSFDSGYYNGWDLPSARHPETILAYAFNGAPLTPAYGAPLRLYAPHKLGYKLTKYLASVSFTRERPGGYWEDQGYWWFAGI